MPQNNILIIKFLKEKKKKEIKIKNDIYQKFKIRLPF
jgi:hypothetical protein